MKQPTADNLIMGIIAVIVGLFFAWLLWGMLSGGHIVALIIIIILLYLSNKYIF
jgi:hypothetical protein